MTNLENTSREGLSEAEVIMVTASLNLAIEVNKIAGIDAISAAKRDNDVGLKEVISLVDTAIESMNSVGALLPTEIREQMIAEINSDLDEFVEAQKLNLLSYIQNIESNKHNCVERIGIDKEYALVYLNENLQILNRAINDIRNRLLSIFPVASSEEIFVASEIRS